jgi:hypothetical protein
MFYFSHYDFFCRIMHILSIEAALTIYRRRLQSVFMWKPVLFWTSLVLIFFAGCGKDTGQPAQPQSQKLTLKDLRPVEVQSSEQQIFFDIVTFELSADKVKNIAPVMARFDSPQVRFYNKELFGKNGLSAYYGRGDDGDKLTSQLRLLDARHVVRTNLITMDKADELISTTILSVERYVFSTLYGDRRIGQAFGPGKIGWVMTPSLTVRRDAVDVKIVPAYVTEDGANIRMAVGKNELGQKPFGQGRLELMMQEGDFLVLAPSRVSGETTLDKMLFGPDGAKNKMRMYVILFLRVG